MIVYLPELYEDELFYSWVARYFCHVGYNAYVYAIEDWFRVRTIRPDMEYVSELNPEAHAVISKKISIQELIQNHSMFPLARFAEPARLQNAFHEMSKQRGNPHNLLPIPADSRKRTLRYCPLCTQEDREKYGETYWHRSAQIPQVNICARHGCGLVSTDIDIKGQQKPRLYIADIEIEEIEPELICDERELQFARYQHAVFHKPVDLRNDISVSDFLRSKLEGTEYLSVRGQQKNISRMFHDMMKYYDWKKESGITEIHQLQKCFTGHRYSFHDICQIAYFLNIPAEELTAPKLPEQTQTERFNRRVADLSASGLGCYRIAKQVHVSPTTALKANRNKQHKEHNYATRTGTTWKDWNSLDQQLYPLVREKCKRMYGEGDARPRCVRQKSVERELGLPIKRLNYLPKCKAEVLKYRETQEQYWARELVWAYRQLTEEEMETCGFTRLLRLTNMRKADIAACMPFLSMFCNEDEKTSIEQIVRPYLDEIRL